MRISDHWLGRWIAGCLVMFLAVPFAGAAVQSQAEPAAQSQQAQPQAQPETSGSDTTRPATGATAASLAEQNSPPPQISEGPPPSAPEQQQQNNPTAPVGTAAAPYEKPLGTPASRPAGAVIAPAKQKRTRSILIRVAVVVGAAVAIGTVVGLSKASPSRPQ
ncbi:MAG TPA: hypothetical protein VN670_07035 [Acidobacteriaceae bacterium]|nr:hypothetical protein [Acidobacteriaceae bacterium]